MPEARLQKVIAESGRCSRRAAEALIAAGRVIVNGEPARPGMRVDPARDQIEVGGVPLRPPVPRVYLALWKPPGVTSTVADRHAAVSVIDLVPAEMLAAAGRLYPVGRLDRDSEGLILLTNDGAWADHVLHPSHGVEREYVVGIARPLTATQERTLRGGVELEEGTASLLDLRPATIREAERLLAAAGAGSAAGAWYRVTLGHGWKRQIRRMFSAVGAPVERLIRVRIGTLGLGRLRPGSIQVLDETEAARIVS